MNNSKDKIIAYIIISVSVILFIVGYLLLPNEIVVQIGFDGKPSNTLPKIIGLFIPFLISSLFAFISLKGNRETKAKNLIISIIGIVIFIFMFIMNH